MCGKHYQRVTAYGTTDLPVRPRYQCGGPECSRRAGASGLCRSHYKQRHLGKHLTSLLVATKDLGRPSHCTVPNCDRPHKARGLCKAHRDQVAKGQDLRPVAEYDPDRVCSESGCEKPAVVRGLCRADYQFYQHDLPRYGLTAEQYERMYLAQGGVCAVCGGTNPNGYRLSIDHDHNCCSGRTRSCGRCVRALLCSRCNFALGHAGDSAERLRAMAQYLDNFSVHQAARAG